MKKRLIILSVWFISILGYSLPSSAEEFDKVETVISNGMGTTLEEASKNAAENALTQVVGTFIDVETQISKRKEISDGIKSVIKTKDKRMNEFSQGSIKSFEIIDTENQNGFIKVAAKVSVRIKDFKAYLKEFSVGEAKISQGLFAQVAVTESNIKSREDILFNKVLVPLLSGEASYFETGKPIIFHESEYVDLFKKYGIKLSGSTIVIPFKIKIKEGFLENMIDTLESVSDKKEIISDSDSYFGDDNFPTELRIKTQASNTTSYKFKDLCTESLVTYEAFKLKDKSTYQINRSPLCGTTGNQAGSSKLWRLYYPKAFNTLVFNIYDTNGSKVDTLYPSSQRSNGNNSYVAYGIRPNKSIFKISESSEPYLNITTSSTDGIGYYLTIIPEREILLAVSLPSDELSKIGKIEITIGEK